MLKRGQKDCKSQRNRKSVVMLYLLRASPPWLPEDDLNKDDTNRQANMEEGTSEASTKKKELQAAKECCGGEK